MFDWNDLKYFLAVARHGTTVAVAKAVNVNQTTVHRRLDGLERTLGRQLISRQPTGYTLTELGQDMVAYAERVEKTAQSFEQRLSASDTDPPGQRRDYIPANELGTRLYRNSRRERHACFGPSGNETQT
jgi:DNA-binding transcriptional LysR family regulator